MKILAIESSCDETAAAVVENGTTIKSNVIASSQTMHRKYGGIVPEVAAREQIKVILPTIIEALEQASETLKSIDAVAVTVGPGLIGSLLVGVETAKTLSFITKKPLIPVNHVLAHMYANFTLDTNEQIQFPAISLVVSGGHTELFLMTSEKDLTWLGGTIDDAAGEAFDKTARLLGFENGGGPAIQKAALAYQMINNTLHFPRPMMHDDTFRFSFSGLKTAIQKAWKENGSDTMIPAFAHEVQEAITDVLVKKTLMAVQKYHAKSILLSGGVAANTRLREKFTSRMQTEALPIFFSVPPVALCTDNAVYIASYAHYRGRPEPWSSVTALPNLSVEI